MVTLVPEKKSRPYICQRSRWLAGERETQFDPCASAGVPDKAEEYQVGYAKEIGERGRRNARATVLRCGGYGKSEEAGQTAREEPCKDKTLERNATVRV
jgi:hypothetical protein